MTPGFSLGCFVKFVKGFFHQGPSAEGLSDDGHQPWRAPRLTETYDERFSPATCTKPLRSSTSDDARHTSGYICAFRSTGASSSWHISSGRTAHLGLEVRDDALPVASPRRQRPDAADAATATIRSRARGPRPVSGRPGLVAPVGRSHASARHGPVD